MTQSNANSFNINNLGGASELQAIMLGVMGSINTGELVKVVAVDIDENTQLGFVSVQPLTYKLDGDNTKVERGIVHNVPFLRLQGGDNGVIVNPKVGDIGFCGICSRDISMVKRIRSFAAPNMQRHSDIADAVYFGSCMSDKPWQTVHIKGGKIKNTTPINEVTGNVIAGSGENVVISSPTGSVISYLDGIAVERSKYTANVNTSLGYAESCSELKETTVKTLQSLTEIESSISAQVAKLSAMEVCLTPPTDIGSVISWANLVITTVITPMVSAKAELEDIASEVSATKGSVSDRFNELSHKFDNCSL